MKDPKHSSCWAALPRLDVPEKVNAPRCSHGRKAARLLTARVVRCPVFGGKVASFNADKAQAVQACDLSRRSAAAIAVVADTTVSAKGAEALQVTWNEGALSTLNSAEIMKKYVDLAQQPGKSRETTQRRRDVERRHPQVRAHLRSAISRARDDGAMNCTADVKAGAATSMCAQGQTASHGAAVAASGLTRTR